eukprot:9591655-Lingulodinium_polyedra.AAC.1
MLRSTLGLERDVGSGNVACMRAVKVSLERLCLPRVAPPPCGCWWPCPTVWDVAKIIEDPSNLA